MGIFSITRNTVLALLAGLALGLVGYHYGYKHQVAGHQARDHAWSHVYRLKIIALGPKVNSYVTDSSTGNWIAAKVRLDRIQLTSPFGRTMLPEQPMAFTADKQVGYTKQVRFNQQNEVIVPANFFGADNSPRTEGLVWAVGGACGGFIAVMAAFELVGCFRRPSRVVAEAN